MSSTSWSAWPAGPIRIGVVVLVCVATVAALVEYPALLRQFGDQASRNSSLSYADREIAGGNSVVADQAAAYAARALIPEGATYHVAVSADYKGGEPLTTTFVESYYAYFLMPRRPADDAEWVICYGCEPEQDPARVETVWKGAKGISILRIRR